MRPICDRVLDDVGLYGNEIVLHAGGRLMASVAPERRGNGGNVFVEF
jgi:hypothetical protein